MPSRRLTLPARAVALSVVPALLLMPVHAPAPAAAAGMTYKFTTTTSASPTAITGVGQVSGDKSRVDYSDVPTGPGANPFMTKGSYMLATRGGATFTVVDPDKKQYFQMDMSALASLVNGMTGILNVKFTNLKIDVQDVGAGEKIAGYATQHVRKTSSYDMEMKVLFMKSRSSVADTMDIWFAPALADISNPFMASNVNGASAINFNDANYAAQQKAAAAKMAQSGAVMKMELSGVSTDDKHRVRPHAMSMLITEVSRADIPASTFEIPSGYKAVESPVPAAPQAAAASTDTSEKVAADSTKQSTKKKGGILGKFHIP
ncbi:MAG: DUF4412 domain-containing protein [Gemmatimonadaceae bacterium]